MPRRIPRSAAMQCVRQLALAVALLTVACGASVADPIPVGTTPADDRIFNFDFTSSLGGPPFYDLIIEARFSVDAGEGVTEDIFAQLDGVDLRYSAGPLTCSSGCPPAKQITVQFSNFVGLTDFLDGIFSVGFRTTAGAPELLAVSATIIDANGSRASLDGQPSVVPEPDTLALIVMGLAAVALSRRRSRVTEAIRD